MSLFPEQDKLLAPDTFCFKQLVFVNSAAYAYTQIRIDQHTALFGENNLGKTSMLNTLKLFLLPEVNFRDCHKKFNFRGTNGKVYDGLASFRYYFPEDRAFIILEAENPHNEFCVVLHRGGATDRQEYARMLVPRPYQEIMHLFWDMEAISDNGVGAPVEEMTLQGTLAALRAMGGEPLSERKMIQERLFTFHPWDKQAGRFCLLPLRNGAGSREIDAWRKLIHLAFDISAQDGRTLPDTLATIIEGQKSRRQEHLSLDLNTIIDEAHQLREAGDRITRIVNASRDWERFDALYHQERDQRQQAAQAYVDLAYSLDQEKGRLKEVVEQTSQRLREAERLEEDLRTDKEDLKKQTTEAEAILKNEQAHAQSLREDINAANATINRFADAESPQHILDVLGRSMEEKERAIEGYEDKEKAAANLQEVHTRLQGNERRAKDLEKALANHMPILLDTLPEADASVLYSLNSVLGATHGELTQEQQQAFCHFASQFGDDQGHLVLSSPQAPIHLPGIRFCRYDPEQNREELARQLKALGDSIASDRKTRDRLTQEGRMSAAEITRLKEEAQQALRGLKREKSVLSAKESNEEKLAALESEIVGLEADLKEKNRLLGLKETAWQEAEQAHRSASRERNDAQRQTIKVENLEERLKSIGRSADNVLAGLQRSLTPGLRPVDKGAIEALENEIHELRDQRDQMEQRLRTLLSQQILDEAEDQALKSTFESEEITDFHGRLKAVFDNLETLKTNHRHQVERHNKTTHAQVEILRTAKDQVSAFMRTINAEMGAFQISNLEEIRIDYKLQPRFQQLLQDLEETDLLGADLQDERIYDQLKAFQADFFSKDATRSGVVLSLDKILEAVTYSYRLRGEDQWTTNAQSNGTNMMITTHLLSVLMARLMEPDTQVNMPLVMDEFGSLATRNMRTAREMAEQNGYFLFVANPNRDAKITRILENYVHLGLFHAERAYARNRCIVHHGLCESLTSRHRASEQQTDDTACAASSERDGAPTGDIEP